MVPFIACQVKSNVTDLEAMKWQAGAVSILLAWSKLLLYLENSPFLGLYVVMFTEVFFVIVVFIYSYVHTRPTIFQSQTGCIRTSKAKRSIGKKSFSEETTFII